MPAETPPDDGPTPASLIGLPVGGLATAREMFAADAASNAWGMVLERCEPGLATVSMTVTATMVNGFGITHGGMVFALADTAFAVACNSSGGSARPGGPSAITVAAGADITFVAATGVGDQLVAQAREQVVYGRSGLYDVTVRSGERVVAEFRGRSRTLPRPTATPGAG